MMGRISLYEQSKLPSAVSGYRTSAAPEVAAIESASQSLGQVVNTYVAVNAEKKRQVANIEAQNAFNDFRATYAGIAEDFEMKSKSAPSKAIDSYKEKMKQEKQRFANQSGANLSDDAKRAYDAMVAQFDEHEGARIETWAVQAKYESVGREGAAGIAAIASQAGATNTVEGFEKGLAKTYESIEKYAQTYPVKKEEMRESARKMATTKFIANAIEKDPDAAVAMLSGDSPIQKYLELDEKNSFLAAAKKQSEAVAVAGQFKNDAAAIATASSLSTASELSGASYGALVAEYAFLPKGSMPRTIHEQVFKGQSAPQQPDEVQNDNATRLLAEGDVLRKTASKMTNARQNAEYLKIVAKAHELYGEGGISKAQKDLIVKLANRHSVTAFGKTALAYANMYADNKDPREYMLYRGLDDLAKNPEYKKKATSEKRKIALQYATQLFDAIDVKTENEPDKYEKLRDNMFSTQEATDRTYQSFVSGLKTEANGKTIYSGYNLLSRAIHGDKYQDVYVDPKTNTEYPIVASSRTGSTYASYTKQFAKELEKR